MFVFVLSIFDVNIDLRLILLFMRFIFSFGIPTRYLFKTKNIHINFITQIIGTNCDHFYDRKLVTNV